MSESQLPRLAVMMTPELHVQIDALAADEKVTFNRACVAHLKSVLVMLHKRSGTLSRVRNGALRGAGRRTRKVFLRVEPEVRELVFRAADHYQMTRSAFVYGALEAMTEILLAPHGEWPDRESN